MRPVFDRLVWFDKPSHRIGCSAPIQRFSARETTILARMARGETNKEIAVGLGVGVQTVKNRVSRILRKLDVHTRFDAARAIAAQLRGLR